MVFRLEGRVFGIFVLIVAVQVLAKVYGCWILGPLRNGIA